MFVIVLINNILIYSTGEDNYIDHLRTVFQFPKDQKLFAKFYKCVFWLRSVDFLSRFSGNGIEVDPI